MSELDVCRRQIKDWEKSFTAESGRLPSKADIKANTVIRKAYKRYQQLKSKAKKSEQLKLKTTESNGVVNVVFSDDSDAEPIEPSLNAELGPTPQANGKVLSLFDMIPSPPESSPLKTRNLNSKGGQLPNALDLASSSYQIGDLPVKHYKNASPIKPLDGDLIFKTPTKAIKPLSFSNLTPSRSSASLSSRLQMAALQSPQKSASGLETPLYLGKVNSRFSFDAESPTKLKEESSPTKMNTYSSSPLRTPTRPPINFQVSPSPLKSQRILSFGGGKRVSALFNELKSIIKDDTYEAQKLEIEEELQGTQNLDEEPDDAEDEFMSRKRRKAKTQKRTTRRWKMKPREGDSTEEGFDGKDVHEELQKISEINQKELKGIITSEEESESDEDMPERPIKKKPASKKFIPVSNNFKRLKINDPRTKKFKQRMKRR